ncbi:MAG TPA: ABC transporter transmembrane domain-containing protein, partial [Deinococcales bacterium]|nr:ABC transporter transmembrane domain-containing protein [Deinococcales bacterium]
MQALSEVFRYVKRYPWQFGTGILMLILSAFTATLAPLVTGQAIDALADGTMNMQNVWGYVFGILGAIGLSALLLVIVRRTILGTSWEVQFDMRRDLFDHFTQLDSEYYDNHRVGDMMARLTTDLNAVRMLVGVGIYHGFNTAMMLVFTFTRMFGLSPRLSLLTLVLVPLTTVTFFLILRVVHRRYERVQRQFANISAMSQENFAGIRVVKGFGIENREVGKFGALNDEFINRNMSLVRVEGPLWPLMEVLFGLTTSVILLIGGRQVLGVGGSLSIGEFSSFLLLFEALSWPIIALGWIANVFQRGVTSWGRLREILERRPRVKDTARTDYSLRKIRGAIEFRNVTLEFGSLKALDDVSFSVPAGGSLGITGRTGSGKTMIVQLLSRTIEPSSGQILIDGHDIREYPLEVLRRHIGLVPQEPFLFSD